MKKNKISKNWINKQRRDTYVRQSKIDGYRARSAYKLIEIDEKFRIFKDGMKVIDIGAAPGSWSQYVSKKVKRGKIISAKRLQTWSPFIINLFLVLEDIDVRVKNQVEAWKIIYETVDPWGLKIIASGSVFIPKVSNDVNIPLLFASQHWLQFLDTYRIINI